MKNMKANFLIIVISLLPLVNCVGQTRTVTLTVSGTTNATLQIQDFEIAKVVHTRGGYAQLAVIKNATQFNYIQQELVGYIGGNSSAKAYVPPMSIIIAGPAELKLTNSVAYDTALITVEIEPATFPPDKTLILPPGTNQVYVGLESSTNLVQWSSATNGIYGSPDVARFFRIKMQRLD